MMLTDIIGLLFLGFFVLVVVPVIRIVLQYTIGPKLFSKRKQLREAGEWAIITGASDGIGKAFAQELAADGLNIMLISRTAAKLEALAEELRRNFGVQVKYIAVDFTKDDIYENIEKELKELSKIACLINNVGMVNVDPLEFAFDEGMCVTKIHDYIACNALSMAALTRIVLPRLEEQNSGAALINIASFSSFQPLPYISLYGATKAFVRHCSQSLEKEVSRFNVCLLTVCPMYVATSMVAGRRGFFVISPTQCARSSLNMLGVTSYCMGNILHELQIFYFSFIPQFLLTRSMQQKLERARKRMLKMR